jgi:hypothetical protein
MELLTYSINSSKVIDTPYYVISPQITKWWDSSWDCLVHSQHININLSSPQELFNLDPYKLIPQNSSSISLKPINQFKFGGGWFNLISTKLLKLIDIPDSLGPYGVDDTYVMICCDILKQKNYQIQQYVLDGTLVAENLKYRWNPYKDYLYLINKQDNFREQAQKNLNKEINNFILKLNGERSI